MLHQLTTIELAVLADAADKPLSMSRRRNWSKDHRSRSWHNAPVASLVRRGYLAIDDDGDLGRRAYITPYGRQNFNRQQQVENDIVKALSHG